MRSITIKAYAKVNLALQVLKKRSDGFHDIKTILQNIDLADTLTFQESSELILQDFGLGLKENLVWRAAYLLKSSAKINKGASITLRKKIPMQAGLGGGSADAAATLAALNKLWDLNLPLKQLLKFGSELGSDVNFFLVGGGLALASGRGEIIEPIKAPLKQRLVIAKPNFGITAKEAYDLWDERGTTKEADIDTLVDKITKRDFEAGDLFNDLEPAVLTKYKQLESISASGYKAGASKVMLSGSGSALFAIVDKQGQDNVYKAWKEENLTVYKVKTFQRSFEKIES